MPDDTTRSTVRALRQHGKPEQFEHAKRCTCPHCRAQGLPPRGYCRCNSCLEWWQAARIVRPHGHD